MGCLLAAAVAASGWGCGDAATAPSVIQQPAAPAIELVTISGRVYASTAPGYPPIGDAIIEVNEADGASATVASEGDGFYRVSVRRGSITITSWKDGFEPKQLQFDVSNYTVLNFSLDPR